MRILIKKVNTNFLANTKAGINIELSRHGIVMTYKQALHAFRNDINMTFPLDIGGRDRSRRSTN